MPRLVLCMDGLVLSEVMLDRERVRIGRKPCNEIQIDDLAISGEHARVTTILGDAFLEDLDSTNGTCVNGKPVSRCALADGDVVELGKYRLKFFLGAHASHLPSSAVRRRKPAEDESVFPAGRESAESRPHETNSGASPGTAMVRVLDGPHAGRELLLVKARTMLGSPGGQVAAITRRHDGYAIVPVEGGRPVVNGVQIDSDSAVLGERAVIELAGVRIEFELRI